MRHLWILGLGLVAGPWCAVAEKLPLAIYTTADGLAHNHINRIKTDSHGFLWFCTDGGLSRFDGRRFFNLTTEDGLPHPDVTDIVEAPDGTFWLSTDGGISKFKLVTPGTLAKPKIETIHSEEHPEEHYDAVEFDRLGRLWAGGRKGLYQVEFTPTGNRVKFIGPPIPKAAPAIPRILADRRSGIWIATFGGAVYRSDDGRYVPIPPSPLDRFRPAQSLHQDRAGRMWIGYRTGGLCRLQAAPQPGPGKVDSVWASPKASAWTSVPSSKRRMAASGLGPRRACLKWMAMRKRSSRIARSTG